MRGVLLPGAVIVCAAIAAAPRVAGADTKAVDMLNPDWVWRAGALDAEAGPVATASSSAEADAGARVVPSPPHGDIGTRWVLAAAIGGLVAGGAIAYYRKRRAAFPR